ncbi:hypothetical protein BVC93_18980 [Mycobacterium sp. MS1601]|uniref:maleylpyruvate isomerase family mycothiol-dependent enzyme n=1 Tax=Mycobacterium sp. MS1601 TaxID=1936029 RepID=UPI0009796A6E|nr:maleylpyruvate isomerase family mycothiol-dependent enzyme [Mycobacterium sp. MS1601]AQA04168.1 hypothetical protein BVC93_18980 [Mycobacterium sp. MS1601]
MISVDALRSATRRFADVLETADITLAVPSCPQWTVEDLVRHLGGIHEWAAAQVGAEAGTNIPTGQDVPREALTTWYSDRADQLVTTLATAGPDAPAWVFGPASGAGFASFWIRRQIHETVVHTWDLLAAQGIHQTMDPELAWDGVQEVKDVFYPRQVALGRIEPLDAALHLHPTDLDRPAVTIGQGEPVTVRLPASEMLLALWHRRTLPDGRAATLMATALTP